MITTTVKEALASLLAQHAEATEMDAGFDAGEFSGPAHAELLEKELHKFQSTHHLSDNELAELLHT